MKVTAFGGDITKVEASAAVVNLFEGVQTPGGATGAVDRAMGGAIRQLIAEGEIKGRKGEITLIHSFGRVTPARVVVLGLGKQKDFSLEVIRSGTAEVCRYLRRIGAKKIATILHGAGIGWPRPHSRLLPGPYRADSGQTSGLSLPWF